MKITCSQLVFGAIYSFIALLISNCAPMQYQAQNNGAIFVGTPPPSGYRVDWSGSIDQNGLANGQGVETQYRADGTKAVETESGFVAGKISGKYVSTSYKDGKMLQKIAGIASNGIPLEYEMQFFNATTPEHLIYEKGSSDANGYVHGERKRIWLGGKTEIAYYNYGDYLSSVVYNADGSVSQPTRSNSPDNSDVILGGMMALGGASSGDNSLANAGISMMGGDTSGAIAQLQNGNGNSGTTNQTNPSMPREKPISANKLNLIDEYELRVQYENHVQYSSHVKAADANFRMYKKTGEERYYKAHESSADILSRWRDIDNGKY